MHTVHIEDKAFVHARGIGTNSHVEAAKEARSELRWGEGGEGSVTNNGGDPGLDGLYRG